MSDKFQIRIGAVIFRASLEGLRIRSVQSNDAVRVPFGYLQNRESVEQAIERICRTNVQESLVFIDPLSVSVEQERGEPELILLYCGLLKLRNYREAEGNSGFIWSELADFSKLDRDLLTAALVHVRSKIRYEPIGYHLLPAQFTLADFRKIYEVILGRDVDSEKFRRKMWKADCLIPLEQTIIDGRTKQRKGLYQFNEQKFADLKKKGFFIDV